MNGVRVYSIELRDRDELALDGTTVRFIAGNIERTATDLRSELGL